jgi:hypothetical protein
MAGAFLLGEAGGIEPELMLLSEAAEHHPVSAPLVNQIGLSPTVLATGHLGFERGVEEGCVFQHGAGAIEEAIGNRSQGAAMAMTPGAQGGVLGFAVRVMLNSNARPMVRG